VSTLEAARSEEPRDATRIDEFRLDDLANGKKSEDATKAQTDGKVADRSGTDAKAGADTKTDDADETDADADAENDALDAGVAGKSGKADDKVADEGDSKAAKDDR
jgi:hypothetical protein